MSEDQSLFEAKEDGGDETEVDPFNQTHEDWITEVMGRVEADLMGPEAREEQTPAAAEPSTPREATPEKPPDPEPIPPHLQAIMEQQTAQAEMLSKLGSALEAITTKITAQPEEPAQPPPPAHDVESQLAKLVSGIAGKDAPDDLQRELQESVIEALVAQRFGTSDAWKDNEQAQAYVSQSQRRLKDLTSRASIHKELAEFKADVLAQLEEMRAEPRREKTRAEHAQLIADMLGAPGENAKDHVAEALPTLAKVARTMELAPVIAKHALDSYRTQHEIDWDGQVGQGEIWGPMHALEAKLAPMFAALDGASVEGRDALAKALRAASGDGVLAAIIDKALATPPTEPESTSARQVRTPRPPNSRLAPTGRAHPTRRQPATDEEWFGASELEVQELLDQSAPDVEMN